MRQLLLIVSLCVVFPASSDAQHSGVFDLESYNAFLAGSENITGANLLQEHPIGAFKSRTDLDASSGLFSDSISLKYELTGSEQQLLLRNGFVVTERLQPNSFGDGFTDIYKKDLPVFVSTDAILHALHMSYDLFLQEIENQLIIPELSSLMSSVRSQLTVVHNGTSDERVLQAVADLDVLLTVPMRLLTGEDTAPVFAGNEATIDQLLNLIDAESPGQYALFAEECRNIDFSQFTPRGHYAEDVSLRRYFKAMIWFGRTELYLSQPGTVECQASEADVDRQVRLAVLMTQLLRDPVALRSYRRIEGQLAFFVGEPDNVTYDQLESLLTAVSASSVTDFVDDANVDVLQDTLATRPFAGQKILSQILFSNDIRDPDAIEPASAFMLFGQRFVVDSFVSGHVVYDEVIPEPSIDPRMLPSTQDILYALGNDASLQFLQDELDEYRYAPNLEAARFLIDGLGEDHWESTFYNGWLDAIRTLNPPQDRTDLPSFMQTAAWWQEKMNTQLASWAQLRHDNLLYAKQSYSGGITCMFPYSYVEPFPDFFRSVSALTRRTAAFVRDSAGEERIAMHFDNFASTSDTLAVIAQKELDKRSLSEEEASFLRRMLREVDSCGPVIDGWYPDLFLGGPDQAKESDLIVADIHTAPTDKYGNNVGWVLHAGTGPLNMAVVSAEVEGVGTVNFVGPVLSYYEHLSTGYKRLTDQDWATAYSVAPSHRPAFVNIYLADASGAIRPGQVSLATGDTEEPVNDPPSTKIAISNYPN
ncbi:MAG: DUF3160 domain-containing protein, partial [Rhodothermales bacterium]|nr:DUF3160 domain-containing protein [Rhodothermales bacterium]